MSTIYTTRAIDSALKTLEPTVGVLDVRVRAGEVGEQSDRTSGESPEARRASEEG